MGTMRKTSSCRINKCRKPDHPFFYQDAAVEDRLSKDEFEALAQINAAKKHERPSACVARNAKRLAGLKYVSYGKDGQLMLTDKGQQSLFVKRCIEGLRAIAEDAEASLDTDVMNFLRKKGHIAPRDSQPGFALTARGSESLSDIDAQ